MEDLEHIWRDVTSTTAGSIPKVIAARLERGHAPAVDLGHVPWREFLDLAAAVGARVVYAELSRLNDDVLSQFESFDEDGSATAETIAARQSVGEPFLLELAFVFDGVVHEW